jgi:hypothetical protein
VQRRLKSLASQLSVTFGIEIKPLV